ncbi:MAG: hypothetical protein PHR47_02005 [Candidatus Pacebacteria bacterium]|nr:hypothetical protein [Candidatus Paceibacterota bacterium]
MKLKTLTKLLLIILLAFFLKKENDYFYFGKTVNSVFPCSQNATDSFSCYANWDIGLILIGLLCCFSLLISAIIDLVKHKK